MEVLAKIWCVEAAFMAQRIKEEAEDRLLLLFFLMVRFLACVFFSFFSRAR